MAAISSPLLDGGSILAEAETIIVSLLGGPDLTLTEVQRAVSKVRQKSERNPHIFMGAAIDENYVGKLSMLVIASRGKASPVEAPAPLPSERELATSPTVEKTATEPVEFSAVAAAVSQPTERFLEKSAGKAPAGKRERLKQQSLGLDVNVKGRFDKLEPTVYEGEDLDLPTFLRRGIKIG